MRLLQWAMVSLVLLSTPAQAWEWRWPWTSADESANKLFVEAVPLWNQYQALPEEDPAQYEARLQLLNQIDKNLKSILKDYPESSLAVELVSTGALKQLNQEQIEAEIPRLQQSIPAATLLAETRPLWLQYQALPQDDPAQYEARLELLKQIERNLIILKRDYPKSYEAIEVSNSRFFLEDNMAQIECFIHIEDCILAEALQTARAIENASERSIALSAVATAQADAGDVAGAQVTIQEALESAGTLEYAIKRSPALIAIATAQARAGDVAGAQLTIQEVVESAKATKDVFTRYLILIELFSAQVSLGDIVSAQLTIKEALETAKLIEREDSRSAALIAIVEAQASAGDVPGALETAKTTKDRNLRPLLFSAVAEAQASAGDIAGAQVNIQEALRNSKLILEASPILEAHPRSIALIAIAEAQASAGDVLGALETANTVEVYVTQLVKDNPYNFGWNFVPVAVDGAWSAVVEAKANAGDIVGALETAELISLGDNRRFSTALNAVVEAQLGVGDVMGAMETVKLIPDEYKRHNALKAVVTARASAGDVLGARGTAEAIGDEFQRSLALSAVFNATSQRK